MFFAPDGADKLFNARGDVIVKPFVIHQRQDAVIVRREGFVCAFSDKFGKAFIAFVGVDQAFAIEGVAAHHATDRI
ncbi:Uncharacterised protein [Klebsiella quasipneumoniae]|nr:Uncharacterised protein [Klebsiella quasipneumoniae]